jgi:small subunit ribosomal protein S27Ae
MGKKGKEANKKGKKQRTGKKHSSVKTHSFYGISGENAERKRKPCPRCGQGTWLGEHKGRLYCGKCGYTEFQRGGQPQPGAPRQEHAKEEPKKEDAETSEQEKPAEEEKSAEEPKQEGPKPEGKHEGKKE